MAAGGGGSGKAVRLLDASDRSRATADAWSGGATFGIAGTSSGRLIAGAGGDSAAVISFF
jgi:hypothetical protein